MVIRLLGPVVADSIEQVEARALIPSGYTEWHRGGFVFATEIFNTGQEARIFAYHWKGRGR